MFKPTSRRPTHRNSTASRQLAIEPLEDRRLLAVDSSVLTINPTGREQEFLQLVNRLRDNPSREFDLMFSKVTPLTTRDPWLQQFLSGTYRKTANGPAIPISVSGVQLKADLTAKNSMEPLVWRDDLYRYAKSHNDALVGENRLRHSSNGVVDAALVQYGLPGSFWNEIVSGGMGIANHSYNTMELYAGYLVDWPYDGYTGEIRGGMQYNSARPDLTHRNIMTNAIHNVVGASTTLTNRTGIRPYVNTSLLVQERNFPLFVTGAVFHDKNVSTSELGYGWYDEGEGLGGVTLVFENLETGQKKETKSLSAGGYQIELLPGKYHVIASGGGLASGRNLVKSIEVTNKSRWVNFIYRTGDLAADSSEPNSGQRIQNAIQATSLPAGHSPSVTNRTLHLVRNDGVGSATRDVDYYEYHAVGTGPATFKVTLTSGQGNVRVELLSSNGTTVLKSANTNNNEALLSQDVVLGQTYYVRIQEVGGPNSLRYNLAITGPETIAPDRYETGGGNNSRGTARLLSGPSPVEEGLSIHSNTDNDWFQYVAEANGTVTFVIEFDHGKGNLGLFLYKQDVGEAVGSSNTSSNSDGTETVTLTATRGDVYLVRVLGNSNPRYTLRITGPVAQRPVAVDDTSAASSDHPTISINVLANDRNVGGTLAELTPTLASNAPPAFAWDETRRLLQYTAPSGFTGWQETTYTLVNAAGLASSASALVRVFVVDYEREAPWQNPASDRSNDTNGDGRVSAVDALMVINYLNDSSKPRNLPTAGRPASGMAGFYDTSGDNRVSAQDALRIINQLNRRAMNLDSTSGQIGNGEGELPPSNVETIDLLASPPSRSYEPHDVAIAQIMSIDYQDKQKRRRA